MAIRWREINTIEHVSGPNRDLPSESRADARASAVQELLNYGNRHSFDQRVEQELRLLAPRAARQLREDDSKGVVAVVAFSQTEHFAGSRVMFRTAYLVGPPYIFNDPQSAINFHSRSANAEPGNANRHKFFWGFTE